MAMPGRAPARAVQAETLEELTALRVRKVANAMSVEVEQVEDHVVDRLSLDARLDHARRGQPHAALNQLEPRAALLVQRDDLAVEDRRTAIEGLGDRLELRVTRAHVLEPPAQHAPLAVVGVAERADPVPLDLVGPVV